MADSKHTKRTFIIVLAVIVVGALAAGLSFFLEHFRPTTSRGPTQPQAAKADDTQPPELKIDVVATNLSHPWDVTFLAEGRMVVSERSGRLSLHQNGDVREIKGLDDVLARGEGGLMGIETDREFQNNQYIYTCYSSTTGDVRLVRWRLNQEKLVLENKKVVVSGIPLNQTGRHSGCRVRMDSAHNLWVGTGDAAIGTHPQNPESLGGKILRVTRDGTSVEGNLGSPFDGRIFSYGHRNTQGIALFDEPQDQDGSAGYSIEHGSTVDDEVNKLIKGNFGWNPVPFYNEQVSMTDVEAYPDAVEAVWRSGNPTIAPSGATILSGAQWKAWNGAVAIAVLKDQHLRIQMYGKDGRLQQDEIRFKEEFGRLRSAVQGPDGNLYLTTDNGDQDRIIKVIPQ